MWSSRASSSVIILRCLERPISHDITSRNSSAINFHKETIKPVNIEGYFYHLLNLEFCNRFHYVEIWEVITEIYSNIRQRTFQWLSLGRARGSDIYSLSTWTNISWELNRTCTYGWQTKVSAQTKYNCTEYLATSVLHKYDLNLCALYSETK